MRAIPSVAQAQTTCQGEGRAALEGQGSTWERKANQKVCVDCVGKLTASPTSTADLSPIDVFKWHRLGRGCRAAADFGSYWML